MTLGETLLDGMALGETLLVTLALMLMLTEALVDGVPLQTQKPS